MSTKSAAAALGEAFLKARDLDAPVNVRLAHYSKAVQQHLPPYADAVDRLVARLQQVGVAANAPAIGAAMPPFLLPDERGRLVSLDEVLSEGPAAIAFHRGHWCPFCRINARALAEVQNAVRSGGGQIVAITPERQKFIAQQKAEAGADYQILSDIYNGYALSLGLAIWLGDDIQRILSDFGRDLPLYQGDPSWFVPIPATFVVARDGMITARFIDPDYRRRMDIDDLRAALAAAV